MACPLGTTGKQVTDRAGKKPSVKTCCVLGTFYVHKFIHSAPEQGLLKLTYGLVFRSIPQAVLSN